MWLPLKAHSFIHFPSFVFRPSHFGIMILLQQSYYLMTVILTKSQASLISSEPEDAFNSIDSGIALLQERDPINFANSEAAQSDSVTSLGEKPNDITFDQALLEGDSILPSQYTLLSASVPGAEIIKQAADNSQDSALLPWHDNGGVPDLIPNLPSLSLPSFPDALKVFENIMKGGVWPEEPDCDDGLFSFCCESGPPKSKIKKGTSADRILEIEAERKQRLRGCVKCLSISPVS